jgi:hypothetical protein
MAQPTETADEQDAPWKKILRHYFPEAIEFFFPNIAKAIDWSQPVEFLNKVSRKVWKLRLIRGLYESG